MRLNVKNKIRLGTAFLMLLIMLMAGAGIYYTVLLKQDSKEVLQDNYKSLAYCQQMQQQLDSLSINKERALKKFSVFLQQQELNITEKGEATQTRELQADYKKLTGGDTSARIINITAQHIQAIQSLNINALLKKNTKAQHTAQQALIWLVFLAAMVIIIAFTFSVNFPSIVTEPIMQITEGITEITNKNYKHRIHLANKDEFGQLADAFNNMGERLAFFESSNLNRLIFEKTRAEAVINSLKEASIGIDKSNQILFANQQALQMLGSRSADIVGKSVAEVAAVNDLFRYLVSDESTAPFKVVVDNRENYYTKESIEIEQEGAESKMIVLKNITSFKELDIAKTNFIAAISHELKTPLASSDLSLKFLEDKRTGGLNDDQKELIQNLRQDNQRMLRILSELLNLAQVESGRFQMNLQNLDAAMVMQKAIANITPAARERSLRIEEHISDNLPQITADAEKMLWVLDNLLLNAVKYASSGGKLNVMVNETSGEVIFSIKDYGPGIAPEYQSRVFERYFQVPGDNKQGSGLGLAISKDFIQNMGGRIWVESKEHEGAVFSFALPVAK